MKLLRLHKATQPNIHEDCKILIGFGLPETERVVITKSVYESESKQLHAALRSYLPSGTYRRLKQLMIDEVVED